jgi:tetratricopeptide (TPR) repeat protein
MIVALLLGAWLQASPSTSPLTEAQQLFYNSRYAEAAARLSCGSDEADLAACELRASALHFQIKRAIGDASDKGKALTACGTVCAEALAAFADTTRQGQAIARARLKKDPRDQDALFYLGKLDLNHVWLHLGTLGRRTGWDEYHEAKRSLEAVLEADPAHIRARVARAWMDYIVGTRVPWGTRWLLGGGNRKRGLASVRDAANAPADFYTEVEADFALWEMLARDKQYPEAVDVAKQLLVRFPDNPDLPRFIEQHSPKR